MTQGKLFFTVTRTSDGDVIESMTASQAEKREAIGKQLGLPVSAHSLKLTTGMLRDARPAVEIDSEASRIA